MIAIFQIPLWDGSHRFCGCRGSDKSVGMNGIGSEFGNIAAGVLVPDLQQAPQDHAQHPLERSESEHGEADGDDHLEHPQLGQKVPNKIGVRQGRLAHALGVGADALGLGDLLPTLDGGDEAEEAHGPEGHPVGRRTHIGVDSRKEGQQHVNADVGSGAQGVGKRPGSGECQDVAAHQFLVAQDRAAQLAHYHLVGDVDAQNEQKRPADVPEDPVDPVQAAVDLVDESGQENRRGRCRRWCSQLAPPVSRAKVSEMRRHIIECCRNKAEDGRKCPPMTRKLGLYWPV